MAASLLEGTIALIAGTILLWRGQVQNELSASVDNDLRPLTRTALQLLGVFFLIRGAISLADPAIAVFFVGAEWSLRASQFAAAAVGLFAGGVLIMRPLQVVRVLSKYQDD